MPLELWTLDNTDEHIDDVIAVLRFALGAAEEAEIIHPETVGALRQWCNAETARLHPHDPVQRLTREQEIHASLRRSPWWPFWENLEKDQEVRWTGTKTATYFVVDPKPSLTMPKDSGHRALGAFIELRRHTGKTFWTHIGAVRPPEAPDG